MADLLLTDHEGEPVYADSLKVISVYTDQDNSTVLLFEGGVEVVVSEGVRYVIKQIRPDFDIEED